MGDPEVGGTSLETPADGPPLLAPPRGLCGEFLRAPGAFVPRPQSRGAPQQWGWRDGDCGFYTRCPQGGFASLQDDLVFSPFMRAVGGLNGDLFNPGMTAAAVGYWQGCCRDWLVCKSHAPSQSSPSCSILARARSSDTS